MAQTFNMTIKNKKNKPESVDIRIQVADDRKWNLSIFGNIVIDGEKRFFNYVRKSVGWENDNPRLESYLKHRLRVAIGKDIFNLPGCTVKKDKYWKDAGAWLFDFGQREVAAGWLAG